MSTITSRLEYLGVRCYSKRSRSQATIVTTDCEFVVNANKRKNSLVYISKLQLEHSLDYPEIRNICTSTIRLQATEVLSTVPYVRPSSVVNLARLKHGVTFSYSSAWRALQCHCQDISKADVISFGQIPYFLHEIEIANSGSTTLTGDHLFKVTSLTSGYTRMVNLETKTCSCMEFQEMQFPCAHAALAISTNRQPVNQFVDRSYLLSSLQSAYSQQIVFVDLDTINCDEALQPPNVVRKTGRPRKVCLRSRGEVDDNDRYACKGCELLGHNVRKCSRRQPPSVLPVDLEEGNQEPFQQLDIGNLNGGPGSKRARVCNVMCINCGSNRYRKTPCQVPIH
ncbi:hypothetical protein BASA61_004094 [Batrachochytrium salamandrivorans]|nr:hypothetical protein BASA61_004094 [Batrachochytrium salamandrivorans]